MHNSENYLNPKKLRNHLVFISLFISAFEFAKDIIISKPKNFFMIGYEDGKWLTSPKYQEHVLSRNKSPLYASLDWFKELSAIDENDIAHFTNIKNKRNQAVHEMMNLLQNGPSTEFEQSFNELITILSKIEKWWFAEIELPLSDLDAELVNLEGVLPGSVLTIEMLKEVAFGDEDERNKIYEEFLKQIKKDE